MKAIQREKMKRHLFFSFCLLASVFCHFISIVNAQTTEVISTDPPSNAIGVPSNTNISATFSTSMDSSSLPNNTFVIYGSQTGVHSGTVDYDSVTKTVILDPEEDFIAGEIVTAITVSYTHLTLPTKRIV